MKSSPLVTVGLPVLDGASYLPQALDSILAQDFDDFELIISDNASNDRTPAIAERYAKKDRRVLYIRHRRREGAAANFNFVARQARGRYFKWMAHDDVCGPQFLSRCVDVLESKPDVVLCHPRAAEIDESGNETRTFPSVMYGQAPRPNQRVSSYLANKTACLEAYGVMHHDTLLATAMIGPYTSSDRVFLLQMVLRGRFEELPNVEFYCRTHPQRSLRRYGGTSDRRQWFGGPSARRQWLPQWRLAAEYGRAILLSPVEVNERALSLLHLSEWMAANRRSLGWEFGAAGLNLGRRVRKRLAQPSTVRQ